MRLFSAPIGAVSLCLVASCAAPAATDRVYKAMREAAIAETLLVENVVLHRDAGPACRASSTSSWNGSPMRRPIILIFAKTDLNIV